MIEFHKFYQELFSQGGPEAVRGGFPLIGVDVRDYPDHQMFLLDYNQIEAKDNHLVSDQCRGLLVSYDGKIIRKGFKRFYNLGQAGHNTFDFEHSIAFEKADGSLCFIYWCAPTNRWEIGTRGTAFAEGPNEWHGTFRNFMLNAMGRTEEQFQRDCDGFDKTVTRLYEAVGPDNRIVTPYTKNHLIALSYVSNNNGSEVVAPVASIERNTLGWNVREIRQYKFNTQEECLVALDALTGLEEGYVVYNTKTHARVKIKNAVYLAAHRLRGNGLTVNAICELVAMNEVDEYIAVFPEDAHKFDPAIKELDIMTEMLGREYEEYKHVESQKDFALAVKDFPLSCCMFKARKNGTDVIHEFNQFPATKRADWIKERLLRDFYEDTLGK